LFTAKIVSTIKTKYLKVQYVKRINPNKGRRRGIPKTEDVINEKSEMERITGISFQEIINTESNIPFDSNLPFEDETNLLYNCIEFDIYLAC
jgi:hypothetical protein